MNWLNNVSLRLKIIIVGAIPLLLMVWSMSVSIFQVQSIGKELTSIAESDLPMSNALAKVTEHQLKQTIEFEKILHYSAVMKSKPEYEEKRHQAKSKFDALSTTVSKEIASTIKIGQQALTHFSTEEETAKFNQVLERLTNISINYKDYLVHANEALEVTTKQGLDQGETLLHKVEKEELLLEDNISDVAHEIASFTAEAALRAEQHEQDIIVTLTILVIVATILAALSSFFIAQSINSRLNELVDIVDVLGSGDLTANFQYIGKDEITRLKKGVGQMRDSIETTIDNISEQSTTVDNAANEFSSISQISYDNSKLQQAEIEQFASTIYEMTTTSADISKNINETANASQQAQSDTNDAKAKLSKLISEVELLSKQMVTAENAIATVRKDSEDINSVLEVIKGIAEQTNLLALNAAIEAARAGEQGRGFAVVADEVRTLATRTQQSTAEINDTIDRLQEGSVAAVKIMQKSTLEVTEIVDEGLKVSESLNQATDSVSTISNMSTQIAAAAEEQSVVTEQINQSIVNINEMGTVILEGTTEVLTNSSNLAKVSEELSELVRLFKTHKSEHG
ncbi:methyl-accepting chemotaxis protein [uncultured Paraglaciecola sp.]|mgnify:CR=1 FL=1|uniref:methyl-accepting chemotaxis protein n=1 Tax=uncultured Paraglaciecola sp. TaxID=1765024 RepID=UPI00260C99DF|nr:methyl-accepting chemotaxis protein [uncultured Paraglaciecola sp.]